MRLTTFRILLCFSFFSDQTLAEPGKVQKWECIMTTTDKQPDSNQTQHDCAEKYAKQGDRKAQLVLAVAYYVGLELPVDKEKAAYWFRKAAEQGEPTAQNFLGQFYRSGEGGLPKDNRQAVYWFRKAAEQGNPPGEHNLGYMLNNGLGVSMNQREAADWYKKAAEHGLSRAQTVLGGMYWEGRGVPKNEWMAYFWWLLASTETPEAIKFRDLIEKKLTPEQRFTAQASAHNWHPTKEVGDRTDTAHVGVTGDSSPDATGSGIRVTARLVVTNHHVIEGCRTIHLNGTPGELQSDDAGSDLALLRTKPSGPAVSFSSKHAEVGENVVVAGFPLQGILNGFNLTTGTLSSLSGINGDTRYLQITAPVQPGNSGGPLLDSAGHLIGVVVSKLDAIKTAKLTGDIPQNVNFAINANILRSFLDASNVIYNSSTPGKPVPATIIGARAKGFTVLVECWK